MKKHLFPLCYGFMVLFSGCSDQPVTEAKKAEAPAAPVTGQTALFRMYQVARLWAPDANVLKLTSIHLTEVPAVRGKAGAWQATFTSAEKNISRSYTYSVIEGEGNLHQGVFPGPQEAWAGPADKTFLIATVKTDSDVAYRTAKEQAAGYDQKNPTQTISFDLEMHETFPNPSWRVIWGESASTASISVLVDAFTGKYLETLH
ncbi:MAG TPA: hypothetical protein VLY24_31375 [Bryobacteraceae bacterium]|nr:hypothetical protein [Bryobacteraceae bacterium]